MKEEEVANVSSTSEEEKLPILLAAIFVKMSSTSDLKTTKKYNLTMMTLKSGSFHWIVLRFSRL
jgi:hypothetical protein